MARETECRTIVKGVTGPIIDRGDFDGFFTKGVEYCIEPKPLDAAKLTVIRIADGCTLYVDLVRRNLRGKLYIDRRRQLNKPGQSISASGGFYPFGGTHFNVTAICF